MHKYKDFDEFFGELEHKPGPQIRLFGKTYALPAELPATTMLMSYKAYKSGKDELSDEQQMAMAIEMLGEENVEEWCQKGLTINKLGEIMKWVAAQHNPEAGASTGKKQRKR
jgi:hypothetical protein